MVMIRVVSLLWVTLVIHEVRTATLRPRRPPTPNLSQFLIVDDFEKYAEANMDKKTFTYVNTGAMLEQTLRDNREAFFRYRLEQSVLHNTLEMDLRTTLLGFPVNIPIGISPTAFQQMETPEGENATAKAAAAEGTIMILSSHSNVPLEQVAMATGKQGVRWFQTLNFRDRNITIDLMKRAEAAGFKAIVLSVDSPVVSYRISAERAKFNFDAQSHGDFLKYERTIPKDAFEEWPTLTWEDVPKLKRVTRLPLVLKGIMTAEDARLAIKFGADAILVSNQGGRQLDGVPATIDALPDIVKAVNGRIEVYMDGGIRTGSDVLKALALGARAVFIGRPNAYGLFAGGMLGAQKVLRLLTDELTNVMHLIGVSNNTQLNPTFIKRDEYYRRPLN